MYWNERHTNVWTGNLNRVQADRLKETVRRVYQNVPFTGRSFRKRINPEDIKSLDDLRKLPFTTKQDLRDNYPYGMFAVPLSEIVRIHASSGTTGKPTVVGYTQRDLGNWAEVMARTFTAAGADNHSVVQVAYGYGLFTGGLGAHYGAERIGASVIPISGGNTKRQIMLMKDFGTTHLACTPSYSLYLAETMEEMGVKRSELKLKAGVFGAEPWTEAMRKEIETPRDTGHRYLRLKRIMGPGVAFDCKYQCGMHINEDQFLPEIIDPETLEPLPYGEKARACIHHDQ